jgi:hypothetical protein
MLTFEILAVLARDLEWVLCFNIKILIRTAISNCHLPSTGINPTIHPSALANVKLSNSSHSLSSRLSTLQNLCAIFTKTIEASANAFGCPPAPPCPSSKRHVLPTVRPDDIPTIRSELFYLVAEDSDCLDAPSLFDKVI